MSDGGRPEAGWYPDPLDAQQYRYWDGAHWTERAVARSATRPAASEVAPPGQAEPTPTAPAPGSPTPVSPTPVSPTPTAPVPERRRIPRWLWYGALVVACVASFAAGFVVGGSDQPAGEIALAGADRATCALQGGTVTCWGAFDGPRGRHHEILDGATSISGGGSAFCARLRTGTASCWTTDDPTPTGTGLSGVVDVAVSSTHSCAVLDDGTVWCWGGNDHGELGTGATGPAEPDPIAADVVDADAVAVGDGFTCVTVGSGAVVCWGRNDLGQAAQPDGGPVVLEPAEVPGVEAASDLVAGAGHVCATVAAGVPWCWGDNGRGQLGRGAAEAFDPTPGEVLNLRGVTSLESSAWSSCAIAAEGAISCWGDDTFGQLGDGRRTDPRRQPVEARLPAPATSVAPGSFHTCAALTDGTLRCWGANSDGQLGDGTTQESTEPVEVSLG